MPARVGIVSSTLQERANFSRAPREGDAPWRRAACCYLDKFQIRSSARGVYEQEARSSDGKQSRPFPRPLRISSPLNAGQLVLRRLFH